MAIHENFDWKILEPYENSKSDPQMLKSEQNSIDNGFDNDKDHHEDEEEEDEEEDEEKSEPSPQAEINYESLIEEVECSSGSENENESDDENREGNGVETTSSEASDSDEVSEENSLESQMLQNMLMEKGLLEKQANSIRHKKTDNKTVGNYSANVKREISSETEDTTNSTESERDFKPSMQYSVGMKSENCSSDEEVGSQISIPTEDEDEEEEDDETLAEEENRDCSDEDSGRNVFDRKPEELDSAIKSISYDEVVIKEEQVNDQFCDLQTAQSLNVHEIQSAVDSIL